jgi:hypothetical protein
VPRAIISIISEDIVGKSVKGGSTLARIMALQGDTRTLEVGGTYYFETATKDWVGRVVSIDGPYQVTLEDASWVSDSGRMHAFVMNGRADGMQIEPVGVKHIVHTGWTVWPHKLFEEPV